MFWCSSCSISERRATFVAQQNLQRTASMQDPGPTEITTASTSSFTELIKYHSSNINYSTRLLKTISGPFRLASLKSIASACLGLHCILCVSWAQIKKSLLVWEFGQHKITAQMSMNSTACSHKSLWESMITVGEMHSEGQT